VWRVDWHPSCGSGPFQDFLIGDVVQISYVKTITRWMIISAKLYTNSFMTWKLIKSRKESLIKLREFICTAAAVGAWKSFHITSPCRVSLIIHRQTQRWTQPCWRHTNQPPTNSALYHVACNHLNQPLPYLGHYAGAWVPNTNPGCGGVAAAVGWDMDWVPAEHRGWGDRTVARQTKRLCSRRRRSFRLHLL